MCDGRHGFAQPPVPLPCSAWGPVAGPPPPGEFAAAFLASVPADLRPLTVEGRLEAVAACRRARDACCWAEPDWRTARVLDYLRLTRWAATRR